MEGQNEDVKPDLKVLEQQDGSVVVDGIDLDDLPEDDGEGEAPAKEEKKQDDAAEKAADADVPDDGGEDHPNDTEAIRAARRERRRAKKQYDRQQKQEQMLRMQQLQRQNQELLERLSAVEQRTHGSEVARIDKAIEDQQVRIQYARMKIAEATKNADGEAMSEAQELLYEARRAAEELENLKRRATAPRQAAPTAPDRMVQRLAAAWMEKNPWYDPSGKDKDSEIALTIDRRLAREGYDPRTPEYWQKLDTELKQYLPHKFNSQDDDDEGDVEQEKPSKPRRNVVTSGGRESAGSAGGKNTFTLSPEQVRAMKDAGMWDDPEKRRRMINRYAQEARKQRGN